jgi:hypothetical protein
MSILLYSLQNFLFKISRRIQKLNLKTEMLFNEYVSYENRHRNFIYVLHKLYKLKENKNEILSFMAIVGLTITIFFSYRLDVFFFALLIKYQKLVI